MKARRERFLKCSSFLNILWAVKSRLLKKVGGGGGVVGMKTPVYEFRLETQGKGTV
jgi:hypothetical protein